MLSSFILETTIALCPEEWNNVCFILGSATDGMKLMGGLAFLREKSCFRLTAQNIVAPCKFATPQNSFVRVVSTWLYAWTHLRTPFGDVFCTKIVQCLRKKKSYLVGVCLCERGVMLKTLFSPGTATLSQTLQGSHIRGNVIHSLALHSSFLHLSPNELPLNYHFSSALPFYDSICLSISDFLSHLPPHPGTHQLFNFIGHR